MPFTVELRAGVERGHRIEQLTDVHLPVALLSEHSDDFRLASGIDPFSDMYFNQVQMRRLKEELIALADLANDGGLQRSLELLVQLAERGSGRPHHYLVFIGD